MTLETAAQIFGAAIVALGGQWLFTWIRRRGTQTAVQYKTDAEVGKDIREYLTKVVGELRIEIAECKKSEAEQRLLSAKVEQKADALEVEVRALRDSLTAAAQAGLTLDEQIKRAEHKLRGLQQTKVALTKSGERGA